MARIRLEVLSGRDTGHVFESDAAPIHIGTSPQSELKLKDASIAGLHCTVFEVAGRFEVEDRQSETGSSVARNGQELPLDDETPRRALEPGDELWLGAEPERVRLRFTLAEEGTVTAIVATRTIQELSGAAAELDAAKLGEMLRALGRAETLQDVLGAVAETALRLAPRATHATVALNEDANAAAPPPPVTRVRNANGAPESPAAPVAMTRSIVRRVIEQRSAILAADAASDVHGSESLLGASIRSTIGVPLWRGDQILGVLQVDNRDAPAMFDRRDVDALGILAANASLAVANARLIERLLRAEEQLKRENQFLRSRERQRSGERPIVGKSRALEQVLRQLDKVADTRVSVLIEGETGTGKELFASAVHYRSQRRDKLFVAQNCAAFPENLLESELFGHKRGAFTGATEEKKGLFEIADGGTLFLDELGEMPLPLQAKLLRALQEGEIRPIGASAAKRVNVRIVAATNRNLEAEVAAGRFREDLYYRLKVFPLRIPPLRERREDIPELAQSFVERYGRELGKRVEGFTPAALAALAAHDWPGNVRELENEVQRAMIQVDDGAPITPADLSPRIKPHAPDAGEVAVPSSGSLKERLDEVERQLLRETLEQHGNNKTSAAKALGITREGLHKKLKSLGMA